MAMNIVINIQAIVEPLFHTLKGAWADIPGPVLIAPEHLEYIEYHGEKTSTAAPLKARICKEFESLSTYIQAIYTAEINKLVAAQGLAHQQHAALVNEKDIIIKQQIKDKADLLRLLHVERYRHAAEARRLNSIIRATKARLEAHRDTIAVQRQLLQKSKK
jgi:hypothetical protein